MERRDLFPILGAAAFQKQAPFTPKFFTPDEALKVTKLAEIILPGSQEAGVIRYIDLVLKYAPVDQQNQWRRGISSMDLNFSKLTREQQDRIVAEMARDEGKRSDTPGVFFTAVKRLTVEAYHFSEAHWKEMGRGISTAASEFAGCTHPEHKKYT